MQTDATGTGAKVSESPDLFQIAGPKKVGAEISAVDATATRVTAAQSTPAAVPSASDAAALQDRATAPSVASSVGASIEDGPNANGAESYTGMIEIPLAGSLTGPDADAMMKKLGATVTYSMEGLKNVLPTKRLTAVTMLAENGTAHTIGVGMSGLPASDWADHAQRQVYNMRSGQFFTAPIVLTPGERMGAPVAIWKANPGSQAEMPVGISAREAKDAYDANLVHDNYQSVTAASKVFNGLWTDPATHSLLEGAPIEDINNWRRMAAEANAPLDNMRILLSGDLLKAYKLKEAAMIQQHDAYKQAQFDASNTAVCFETHSGPSFGEPPAHLTYHTTAPPGHAIGAPIPGYHAALPDTQWLRARITYHFAN